jgi:hypothetical protein
MKNENVPRSGCPDCPYIEFRGPGLDTKRQFPQQKGRELASYVVFWCPFGHGHRHGLVATLWQIETWCYCVGHGGHCRHIGGSSAALCNAVSVIFFAAVSSFPGASYL